MSQSAANERHKGVNSVEYQVVQVRFGPLVKQLQNVLTDLAIEFFSAGLIGNSELRNAINSSQPVEDRATAVLLSILSKIESNTSYFNDLVDVLEDSSLKDNAKNLRAAQNEKLCLLVQPTCSTQDDSLVPAGVRAAEPPPQVTLEYNVPVTHASGTPAEQPLQPLEEGHEQGSEETSNRKWPAPVGAAGSVPTLPEKNKPSSFLPPENGTPSLDVLRHQELDGYSPSKSDSCEPESLNVKPTIEEGPSERVGATRTSSSPAFVTHTPHTESEYEGTDQACAFLVSPLVSLVQCSHMPNESTETLSKSRSENQRTFSTPTVGDHFLPTQEESEIPHSQIVSGSVSQRLSSFSKDYWKGEQTERESELADFSRNHFSDEIRKLNATIKDLKEDLIKKEEVIVDIRNEKGELELKKNRAVLEKDEAEFELQKNMFEKEAELEVEKMKNAVLAKGKAELELELEKNKNAALEKEKAELELELELEKRKAEFKKGKVELEKKIEGNIQEVAKRLKKAKEERVAIWLKLREVECAKHKLVCTLKKMIKRLNEIKTYLEFDIKYSVLSKEQVSQLFDEAVVLLKKANETLREEKEPAAAKQKKTEIELKKLRKEIDALNLESRRGSSFMCLLISV